MANYLRESFKETKMILLNPIEMKVNFNY